jgi:hypothetical protein
MEQSMTRKERIKEIKDYPTTGPHGEDRKANLEYWAKRATENSDAHKHRAKGGRDVKPKLKD